MNKLKQLWAILRQEKTSGVGKLLPLAEKPIKDFSRLVLGSRKPKVSLFFSGNAASCIAKSGADKKLCQDVGLVAQKGEFILLGVLDGLSRGGKGPDAAKLCADEIAKAFFVSPQSSIRSYILQAWAALEQHKIWLSVQEVREKPGAAAAIARIWPDGRGVAAWVGNCRAYRVKSDGTVAQLSKDHSYFELGKLAVEYLGVPVCLKQTPDDLSVLDETQLNEYKRFRGGMTSFIGSSENKSQSLVFLLSKGDSLVLCTDGIGEVMTRREISLLTAGKEPKEAASALMALAKSRPDARNHVLYENKWGEKVLGHDDDKLAIIYRQP